MNEKYQQYLEHIAAHAQAELDKWGDKFKENPLHRLEWADNVFSAGGKLAAVKTLMYYLDSTEDFRVMVMKAAIDSGRFAKASSSPSANLLDAHTRQWIAALAHDINQMRG